MYHLSQKLSATLRIDKFDKPSLMLKKETAGGRYVYAFYSKPMWLKFKTVIVEVNEAIEEATETMYFDEGEPIIATRDISFSFPGSQEKVTVHCYKGKTYVGLAHTKTTEDGGRRLFVLTLTLEEWFALTGNEYLTKIDEGLEEKRIAIIERERDRSQNKYGASTEEPMVVMFYNWLYTKKITSDKDKFETLIASPRSCLEEEIAFAEAKRVGRRYADENKLSIDNMELVMKMSEEMAPSIDVLLQWGVYISVQQSVSEILRQHCEGCSTGHPSQQQHMMDGCLNNFNEVSPTVLGMAWGDVKANARNIAHAMNALTRKMPMKEATKWLNPFEARVVFYPLIDVSDVEDLVGRWSRLPLKELQKINVRSKFWHVIEDQLDAMRQSGRWSFVADEFGQSKNLITELKRAACSSDEDMGPSAKHVRFLEAPRSPSPSALSVDDEDTVDLKGINFDEPME